MELAIMIGLQASGRSTFCRTHLPGTHVVVSKDAFPDARHRHGTGGFEKLVPVSAGVASAAFSVAAGVPAHFDSRIWLGTDVTDVVDDFSWRQATGVLDGASTADKNELLHGYGINFNDVPAWQRRGIGLWPETYQRPGHDPVRGVDVTATRRRIRIEPDLPIRDAYRELVEKLVTGAG